MKLQLDIHQVKGARFGERTAIENGVLSVNRDQICEKLAADARLSDVQVELARPGESCRIIRVVNVIEPRARDRQSGPDFPGTLPNDAIGKRSAGDGRTVVLRGAAVVLCEPPVPGSRGGTGEFIDMSGPAAEITPYGKCQNVVLLARPGKGATSAQYHVALKLAGLKAAVYLARAGLALLPDRVETFDLASEPACRGWPISSRC